MHHRRWSGPRHSRAGSLKLGYPQIANPRLRKSLVDHPPEKSTRALFHTAGGSRFPCSRDMPVLEATGSTVVSLGCAQHSRRICALCTHPCPLRDFVIGGVIFPAVWSRNKTRRTAALDVLDGILRWRR